MADLINRGVAKGPAYDTCSHCCILFWPAGLHDEACTPLRPRTTAEREATKMQYQDELVHAKLRASERAYTKRNYLTRNAKRAPQEKRGE